MSATRSFRFHITMARSFFIPTPYGTLLLGRPTGTLTFSEEAQEIERSVDETEEDAARAAALAFLVRWLNDPANSGVVFDVTCRTERTQKDYEFTLTLAHVVDFLRELG